MADDDKICELEVLEAVRLRRVLWRFAAFVELPDQGVESVDLERRTAMSPWSSDDPIGLEVPEGVHSFMIGSVDRVRYQGPDGMPEVVQSRFRHDARTYYPFYPEELVTQDNLDEQFPDMVEGQKDRILASLIDAHIVIKRYGVSTSGPPEYFIIEVNHPLLVLLVQLGRGGRVVKVLEPAAAR